MRQRLAALLKGRDALLVVLGLALSVAVFHFSRGWPRFDWADGGPPSFFPRLLAVLLGLLCLALVVQMLLQRRSAGQREQGAALRVAASFLGLLLAVPLLHWIGFRLTAIVLGLFVMALLIDWRSINLKGLLAMLLTALGAALLLHVLFHHIAGRRLPAGVLFG